MGDIDCKKPKPCEPKPPLPPVPCSPAFNLCVGDRVLKWDGFCPTVERTKHTADGTYTAVTVVDGCIVGYGYAEIPTYTPPYCSPAPSSCQSDNVSAAVGGDVKISPDADNSLLNKSSGLFSRTYVRGGSGVAVKGTGTVSNPYIISLPAIHNTGTHKAVIGRNGLISENTDAGTTYIGLEEVSKRGGTYGAADQFTIDRYGRVVGVEPRHTPLVQAGAGLTASEQNGSLVIAHDTQVVDTNMMLGAYNVSVSPTGHVVNTERVIDLTAGVYNIGAYKVSLNEYGSVTNIQQSTDVMPSSGTFSTADGKIISYDMSGRLTGIASNNSSTPTVQKPAPIPLRDMYKVIPSNGIGGVKREIYGNDTQMVRRDRNIHITLPDYVIQNNQISVNGATSWHVDVVQSVLVVDPDGDNPFTVAFRG